MDSVIDPLVGFYEVCIWPDGMWILRDEYSEHEWQWHGDDFRVVKVSTATELDQLDNMIAEGKL